jgi:hypothetical protein
VLKQWCSFSLETYDSLGRPAVAFLGMLGAEAVAGGDSCTRRSENSRSLQPRANPLIQQAWDHLQVCAAYTFLMPSAQTL